MSKLNFNDIFSLSKSIAMSSLFTATAFGFEHTGMRL